LDESGQLDLAILHPAKPEHGEPCPAQTTEHNAMQRTARESAAMRPGKLSVVVSLLLAIGIVVGPALISHSVSAAEDPQQEVAIPPDAQAAIQTVEARIDRYEAFYLKQFHANPPDRSDPFANETTLGTLLLYDKRLSVKNNEACAFCHMPETGFTGPVSTLNQTTGSYPGSVRSRFGNRKPQSYTYATFAPIFHYNATQENFYGGNFWDGRATGTRLASPSAEQAQGPPDNPVEMGFTDFACFVYRASRAPYRSLAEAVWGGQIFAIEWPADTESICSQPGGNYDPVHLSKVDRGRAQAAYDELALSIAQYEAHPPVNRFGSKFDYYLAGDKRAQLTPDELRGWELFRTKANCNSCHLDGTQNNGPTPGPGSSQPTVSAPNGTEPVVTNLEPLFTDFTFANLGVPRNPGLPYLHESQPDQYGFTANPDGLNFHDGGLGALLRETGGSPKQQWSRYSESFEGAIQTPTLRNVDLRPGLPSHAFVKAYMHNGYFKSLKEVVHFYNTRDKYQVRPGQTCAGKRLNIDCFPAPDSSKNLNMTIGNLHLTDHEEDQIVGFLETLTDGYNPATGRVEVPKAP
jgi:cytochrome c peroxidase